MDSTRETKSELSLRLASSAVILAGIIILSTGIYYCVIKAGIPYQDPPLELQIQYAINTEIGNTLIKEGFLISICGGIARWLLKLILKKRRKKYTSSL
jgi:uncharacterized membrane protein